MDQPVYPHVEGCSQIFAFFAPHQNPGEGARHAASPNPGLEADFFEEYLFLSSPLMAASSNPILTLLEPYKREIPLISHNGRLIAKIPLQPFPPGYWTVELEHTNANGVSIVDTSAWMIHPIKISGGSVISDDADFRADFEKNAVYRTLYARVASQNIPDEAKFVSRIYGLEPDDMPLKGNVSVSIKIPAGESQPEQLGVYGLSPKGIWKFLDNDRQRHPGFVTGPSPRLEKYALKKDDVAPQVAWLSPNLTTSQRRPTFRLSVKDELSGFDDRSIMREVDGQFVLMEYDPEAGTVFGAPDQALSVGSHSVTLSLKDFCGNETRLERALRIVR
jgi:hypothetical protein